MGEPKHAQRYCGKNAPSVTCLADESHDAYAVYGLGKAGLGQLLTVDVLRAGARAFSNGHRQTDTGGDKQMLPGTFIVDRTGTIRYAYYSDHPGDHPPIDELTAAGQRLTSQP